MNGVCHINLARGWRGGERQTELLIRALAERGVRQRVITRAGQPLATRLASVPGLEIRAIDKPFLWRQPLGRGWLMHAHDAKAAKLAYLCYKMYRSPYLITRRVAQRPGGNPLTRAVYRNAAIVATVSASVAAGLRRYRPALDPRVIRDATGQLPADPERARTIHGRWPDRFLVVNAAALVQSQKGQLHLIEVARRFAAEGAEVQFALLGDGRDRARMQQAAADLNNLHFTGFVDNVGDYLLAADAFVLPSLHEGLGSACLDAMAFGLPIVASAVGGVPEAVVDGYNGLLVAPADETALHAALLRLRGDPPLHRRLGAAGRLRAREFTPAIMAGRYLAAYREIGVGVHVQQETAL